MSSEGVKSNDEDPVNEQATAQGMDLAQPPTSSRHEYTLDVQPTKTSSASITTSHSKKRKRSDGDEPSAKRPCGRHNSAISHWIEHGTWPQSYFNSDPRVMDPPPSVLSTMSQALSDLSRRGGKKKKSTPATSADQSQSGVSGVSESEGKDPKVRSSRYQTALKNAGIDMITTKDVTTDCKAIYKNLLSSKQPIPEDTCFQEKLYEKALSKLIDKNEARVIRDIGRLVVPSAEMLFLHGATQYEHLIESTSECWVKSIALVKGPRPHPDYAVGIQPSAFTPEQLRKLQPAIGEIEDTSRVAAIDDMLFPFLTEEVKCGKESITVADRQNAHSSSVAANGVVEIYKIVSRLNELHGKILVYSISHDHATVCIYGHFVLVNGKNVKFYRRLIRQISLLSEDGKDRWATYVFTRNLYDIFYPIHLKRICSAIDQLPDPGAYSVSELSSAGSST